jgi:hypothetical protein
LPLKISFWLRLLLRGLPPPLNILSWRAAAALAARLVAAVARAAAEQAVSVPQLVFPLLLALQLR